MSTSTSIRVPTEISASISALARQGIALSIEALISGGALTGSEIPC